MLLLANSSVGSVSRPRWPVVDDGLAVGLPLILGREVRLISVQPSPWPEPAPEVSAAVRAAYRQQQPPLPVTIRDRLGGLFADLPTRSSLRRSTAANVAIKQRQFVQTTVDSCRQL